MRDAHYFRTQAELCLELARQMSDPVTADNLRAQAARYHEQAAEVEECRELARIAPTAEHRARLATMCELGKISQKNAKSGLAAAVWPLPSLV